MKLARSKRIRGGVDDDGLHESDSRRKQRIDTHKKGTRPGAEMKVKEEGIRKKKLDA
jgi:hypothetical protein